MSAADLVAFTKIPLDLAVIRVNGERQRGQIQLKAKDEVRIRRLVKKRNSERIPVKARPTDPELKEPKKTEYIWIDGVRQEVVWETVFPMEWLKMDGGLAVMPSFVRANPNAEEWLAQMEYLAATWGKDSNEFKRYANLLAEYTQRPVQEVYTLFFSG